MECVSIIVPMYNVEKYVEKCLKSLLKQTYKNIKIYAVSDGSPDNSLKIAEKYSKKDNRIICIDKINGGYGSVLESTINMIDTKYFLICDPDDWLEDNAIETLINEEEKNNLDLVIGDRYDVFVDGDIKKIVRTNTNYPFINISENIIEEDNIEKYCFLYVSPHAKLYRTEVAKNIIFPHKVSYTDFILYTLSLTKCNRVEYINKPLAYYLIDRPGNTNTDRSLKAINAHIIVWNSIYEQISKDGLKHNYIYNRLYHEFKMILKSYSKYSEKLFNDDIYSDLIQIHKKLIIHKKSIISVNNELIKKRLDYKLLLNKRISLKFYIKLNRLLSRW